MRSYFFGAAWAQDRGLAFDRELLFVSTLPAPRRSVAGGNSLMAKRADGCDAGTGLAAAPP
ncbi:hypothetical protein [Streptomyces sp. NPDC045470]|uniref:hypothetical protein n=1 Tax=unclassified Streptomyces TaxID=2593676 RepID=UPI0033FBFEDD